MQRITSERPDKTKVYFLATCLVDLLCPEAGIDNIALFKREGVTVHDNYSGSPPLVGGWSGSGQERSDGCYLGRLGRNLLPPVALPRVRRAGDPLAFTDTTATVRLDRQPYPSQTRRAIAARFAG